jgi:hypothetical protein
MTQGRRARVRHADEAAIAGMVRPRRLQGVRVGKNSTWSQVPGEAVIVRGPRDRCGVFGKIPMMSSRSSKVAGAAPGRSARLEAAGSAACRGLWGGVCTLTNFLKLAGCGSPSGLWQSRGGHRMGGGFGGHFLVVAPRFPTGAAGGCGDLADDALVSLASRPPTSYCPTPK